MCTNRHHHFTLGFESKKGLFYDARNAFESNAKYRNLKEEIDEIWFFFDTEVEMRNMHTNTHKKLLQA